MDVSEDLGRVLNMPVVYDPGTYLGVPAMWGCSKRQGLAYVKGRILRKLQGWKQSTLSQVGKKVLIKAIAQAILAYPMNLLKFPVAVCNELDSTLCYSGFGGDKLVKSGKFIGCPKTFWIY